jgi:hypothetical protein
MFIPILCQIKMRSVEKYVVVSRGISL